MQCILTTGWEDGIADLTKRLTQELATGRNVLWLVSGGSNIDATVSIMDTISAELSKQLTILLADERYGPVGHADSNWTQLLKAGLEPQHAQLLPVLVEGKSFAQTQAHYEQLASWALDDADVVIAQLGIGNDGHIAGILPDSTAAHEQQAYVAGYRAAPFERLTLTFPALSNIDAAYVFAFGNTKRQALVELSEQTITVIEQPAQILKTLPEAYLYSDQIGESS